MSYETTGNKYSNATIATAINNGVSFAFTDTFYSPKNDLMNS